MALPTTTTTSTRAVCTWSRPDHMTNASLRGNQLVSSRFPLTSQGPRGCLVSHLVLVSTNATSRTRESACRVELAPTLRQTTPGPERMGQQRIRHYQHPTDRYRHQQDTHTAHILLVQVRFQYLRCWVYARIVQYSRQRHDIIIPMFNFSCHLFRFQHG